MKSWRRPADEGLKLFLSHVDAVVLDYQMPGMKGDVVAAKMKEIDKIAASLPRRLSSRF
jgi:CheY-like chemotaxis protein